ncbi:hypothetical protein C4Q27_01775 [Pseudomonas sp. SWI36]|nr:hypothetical protein C4Q27_01775 [Pseudomonas sp. SWI36]
MVGRAGLFAGKPAPTRATAGCGSCVGAGLPAKGPGLPANFQRPFTVAAATGFAGKPAPTGEKASAANRSGGLHDQHPQRRQVQGQR